MPLELTAKIPLEFVQISAIPATKDHNSTVFALDKNGVVYAMPFNPVNLDFKWVKLPMLESDGPL